MKKITTLLIIVFLMVSPVYGQPTEWAEDLVSDSEALGLVPNHLSNLYQDNITRYEYVLLALEVAKNNGLVADITNKSPFTDILSHPFEDQIVEAYNLGLVDGYEDQTFRPNNDISREEVSALVYNLVKGINRTVDFPENESELSDSKEITPWALPFVQFVYQNAIMSGTGKKNGLDTIDPKGLTSREQAIVLLYKVYLNNELLDNTYEDIALKFLNEIRQSKDVQVTANHVGKEALKLAITYTDTQAEFMFMTDTSFTLIYPDGSSIAVVDSQYEKDVDLTLVNLDNALVKEHYLGILKAVFPDHGYTSVFNSILYNFEINSDYVRNDLISDGGIISNYSEMIDDIREYYIMYKREK